MRSYIYSYPHTHTHVDTLKHTHACTERAFNTSIVVVHIHTVPFAFTYINSILIKHRHAYWVPWKEKAIVWLWITVQTWSRENEDDVKGTAKGKGSGKQESRKRAWCAEWVCMSYEYVRVVKSFQFRFPVQHFYEDFVHRRQWRQFWFNKEKVVEFIYFYEILNTFHQI